MYQSALSIPLIAPRRRSKSPRSSRYLSISPTSLQHRSSSPTRSEYIPLSPRSLRHQPLSPTSPTLSEYIPLSPTSSECMTLPPTSSKYTTSSPKPSEPPSRLDYSYEELSLVLFGYELKQDQTMITEKYPHDSNTILTYEKTESDLLKFRYKSIFDRFLALVNSLSTIKHTPDRAHILSIHKDNLNTIIQELSNERIFSARELMICSEQAVMFQMIMKESRDLTAEISKRVAYDALPLPLF